MPDHQEWTREKGWYVATVLTRPTEIDAVGCDGLYIKRVQVKSILGTLWYTVTHPIKVLRALDRLLAARVNREMEMGGEK